MIASPFNFTFMGAFWGLVGRVLFVWTLESGIWNCFAARDARMPRVYKIVVCWRSRVVVLGRVYIMICSVGWR